MTEASEGVGDADLPGLAEDDFPGFGEKGETHYDTSTACYKAL